MGSLSGRSSFSSRLPVRLFDTDSAIDYKKMDVESLNRMVVTRIGELQQEGLVDHHFQQCYSLKEDNGPSFFVELVAIFLDDVQTTVQDIAETLNYPTVNFKQMYAHFIKLKGSSACFGACKIGNACSKLGQAIEKNSKDRCIEALNAIKHEHTSLQEKLDGIIKLEKEIVDRATRQR